jgi:hypothetical protein
MSDATLSEVLAAVDISVEGKEILLTDDARVTATTVYISPSQLEAAGDQYRLMTGENADIEALQNDLEWED